MKILLGVLVGAAASKPLMKMADKYLGRNVKVALAQRANDALYSLYNRTSDYLKENV